MICANKIAVLSKQLQQKKADSRADVTELLSMKDDINVLSATHQVLDVSPFCSSSALMFVLV